jgi:hypothetical protein
MASSVSGDWPHLSNAMVRPLTHYSAVTGLPHRVREGKRPSRCCRLQSLIPARRLVRGHAHS